MEIIRTLQDLFDFFEVENFKCFKTSELLNFFGIELSEEEKRFKVFFIKYDCKNKKFVILKTKNSFDFNFELANCEIKEFFRDDKTYTIAEFDSLDAAISSLGEVKEISFVNSYSKLCKNKYIICTKKKQYNVYLAPFFDLDDILESVDTSKKCFVIYKDKEVYWIDNYNEFLEIGIGILTNYYGSDFNNFSLPFKDVLNIARNQFGMEFIFLAKWLASFCYNVFVFNSEKVLEEMPIEHILGNLLEDDETEEGGTEYSGERVEDFLGYSDLTSRSSISELNKELIENGIKPFKKIKIN